MRTNFDLIQRAVVLKITMMDTLMDGTFNRLIDICVHVITSFSDYIDSMTQKPRNMPDNR